MRSVARVESPAILDLRWCPRLGPSGAMLLGQANEDGTLHVSQLKMEGAQPSLAPYARLSIDCSLCLSLDWTASE